MPLSLLKTVDRRLPRNIKNAKAAGIAKIGKMMGANDEKNELNVSQNEGNTAAKSIVGPVTAGVAVCANDKLFTTSINANTNKRPLWRLKSCKALLMIEALPNHENRTLKNGLT